jgi:preprotein translocase subunit YajC
MKNKKEIKQKNNSCIGNILGFLVLSAIFFYAISNHKKKVVKKEKQYKVHELN